jgi:hypothetical protein
MTDKHEARRTDRKDEYEAPQAIRLTDTDRAFGQCGGGSTLVVGYRVNNFEGVCVTGKSATDGCYAGVGPNCQSGSADTP